ncbi:Rad52/22 double-strand break repair protein [Kalmanozyma brasiliensis GHG001]|uniref:RAD52 n=1 Tax=Kalmanozyma brasiliensis TaxID=1392244 RepID=A0AA48P7W9_9BASI|nr:Rad52/22 double-strand break repair protein [Kalmanozyma brasiliensis GHG001]EST09167.2 Rad52/22 double-strand break repair protein [Kalmanozyma brasiliensis GHG001]DBA11394.1 TPA_inf: RAD52 [Kalmanozyma brasiliensis]
MNSAALYSAKLIAEFEKQDLEQQEPIPKYPSDHPFGADRPGPFGGAAADHQLDHRSGARLDGDTFGSGSGMSNFADWDAGYPGGAPANGTAAQSTELVAHGAEAGPSSAAYHPRALTNYDYPGGWGAQTFSGVGGLTQDSASRIATLQAKLNQRLGPEYLSQRPGPGGGKKLTYIEGWKLVDLANEVFGFNGWSTTIVRLEVDYLDCSPDGTRFNAGVSCIVRVSLRDGAFHEDVGYGSADNAKQKHAALEKGKKEAVTDATKRALKNFGKLLGNCTYDHQYSANALKVSNPPPKFDASELHRRPELRPAQAPAPQPPPSVQPATAPPSAARAQPPPPNNVSARPPPPQPAQRAAPPAPRGNETAAHVPGRAPAAPAATSLQQQVPANGVSAATRAVNGNGAVRSEHHSPAERSDETKDEVSERQQRSMLARQAYLERQQAEARKAGSAETHQVVTAANGARRHAAESEFGSDSFDEQLTDALAGYDETSMGDAEAASHALEMEIDEAQRRSGSNDHDDSTLLHPNHNGADDSGVAFMSGEESILVKQEKVKALEMRRSTSPVKQVKTEAAVPRRAGSVGRFISPPPPQGPSAAQAGAPTATLVNGVVARGYTSGANLMRNGTTSLSAASMGAGVSRNPAPRRMYSTTLSGIAGAEAAAGSNIVAGRATGEPVNHAYVPGDARGVKRPSDALAAADNGRPMPRQPAAAVNGNARQA